MLSIAVSGRDLTAVTRREVERGKRRGVGGFGGGSWYSCIGSRRGDTVWWVFVAALVVPGRQMSDYGQAVCIERLRLRQGAGCCAYRRDSTVEAVELGGGGLSQGCRLAVRIRQWQAQYVHDGISSIGAGDRQRKASKASKRLRASVRVSVCVCMHMEVGRREVKRDKDPRLSVSGLAHFLLSTH